MSKRTKIWLMVATLLVLVGTIIFAGVMIVLDWDFLKLDTTKYETNTYAVTENFSDITINTKNADVKFALSKDGECKVVCYEKTKVKHSISIENSILEIKAVDQRKWYNYIGFFDFKTPKITIYLPKTAYGTVVIKNDTGDIQIPKGLTLESVDISASTGDVEVFANVTDSLKVDLSTGKLRVEELSAGSIRLSASTGDISVKGVNCAGNISAKVSTGDIKLTDVSCNSITSSGSSTGDVSLKNVVANGKLSLKTSTGDIKLELCDASELFVTTDTGDVKGSLLSEKVFIVKTDTGDVNVPKTITGGKCEITTTTGNIKITITP